MKSDHVTWMGTAAVRLTGGKYTAVILPSFGANSISLRHADCPQDCFRQPDSAEELSGNPNVYGIPLLFPPNRIRAGRFTFEGREYRFPINDVRGNHMHGFLSAAPFRQTGDAEFRYDSSTENRYDYFPHAFSVTRAFRLDDRGLRQSVTVTNQSGADMPCGVGFHSALNLSFDGDQPGDVAVRVPVKREWLFDPVTIIPTLEKRTASPLIASIRSGEFHPEEFAVSDMMEVDGPDGYLQGTRHRLCWHVCDAFRFNMMWNWGGRKGFLCPEPMSWMIDAPNLPIPAEESGMDFLRPGETRTWELDYSVE